MEMAKHHVTCTMKVQGANYTSHSPLKKPTQWDVHEHC